MEAYPKPSERNLNIYLEMGRTDINMVAQNNTKKDPVQYSLGGSSVGAMQGISDVHTIKAAFGAPNTCTHERVQVWVAPTCTHVHMRKGAGHMHLWCSCTGVIQETTFIGPAPPLAYSGDTLGINFILRFEAAGQNNTTAICKHAQTFFFPKR